MQQQTNKKNPKKPKNQKTKNQNKNTKTKTNFENYGISYYKD